MCGIAGIYNYGGSPVDKTDIRAMCDTIHHRGPDDEGVFIHDTVGLGIRRLAVIDIAGGHQPMHNEDSTLWIVFNGEIYNFAALRQSLEKDHRFYTDTDTEVILHLYERYGENCVSHLQGMFAFAIWDRKSSRLFMARDRIGKKPLYYTLANGSLVFGSEIKSILAYLDATPDIDPVSIDLFLTYQYIPSPRTIFKGIASLEPAHTLTCEGNGKIATRKYWGLDFTPKTSLSFSDAGAEIRELLTSATRQRMIADVPLGAFLSGGMDSSIVVGLMSSLSSAPIKTFSIGFEEDDYSELPYAAAVARHFKTDHHEFIVRPNYIDIIPRLVWYYGQPFADSSALPSYIVARETRKHVTVALNGDGGDENFAGYLRYKALKGSSFCAFPFQLLGKGMTQKIASFIPHSGFIGSKKLPYYIFRLIDALSDPPEERNIIWHSIFTDVAKQELYSSHFKNTVSNDAYRYMRDTFSSAPAADLIDRALYTDIKTYLPECLLVKMDIASMANSLEARSPFLDYRLMEFAASLPSAWKLRRLTTKYILKKTFANFLPPEILHRRKMGFAIPLGKWFRNEWREYFKRTVLSDQALARNYFERDRLERLFQEHVSGKRDHGYRMWTLLILELWHRIYVDKMKLF